MRGRILAVVAVVALVGVQCSSGSSGDSSGSAGTSGEGGAAHGDAGSAGEQASAGTPGVADAGASTGGSATSEGGQSAAPGASGSGAAVAGSDGASLAGAAGAVDIPGAAGAAGAGANPVPKPIAQFGQVRFLNLAPNAVPIDLCMKQTGAAAYTAGPILQANGAPAGVPFGSQTKYVAVPLSFPTAFDFVFVAGSATTCDPPWLGAFGAVTFNPGFSTTIAVFQTTFPSSGNYNGAVFADVGTQTPHTGNVRIYYVANVLSSAIDFHARRAALSDETWLSNFGPGGASGFHASALGTYEFRALKTATATVLADKPGVAVAADDPLDLFMYESGTGLQAFIGCPSNPGTTPVAACTR